MKKIIAAVNVSLLALAVGVAGAAPAQTTKSTSTHPVKSASSSASKAKASKPLTHTVSGTLESFDPTAKGPGYTWHCHILDHEDNEMMRPYLVAK